MKLVVIVDVLDRRRLDGLQVGDAHLALFKRAPGPSDDSAMSAIWDRFDGAGAVSRARERLGLPVPRRRSSPGSGARSR